MSGITSTLSTTSTAATTGSTGSTGSSRTRTRIADILTVLTALGIGYVGISYLVAPESTAAGFGLPEWPHGGAAAFLDLKGIRDLASGIAPLVLLCTGRRRALGWLLLVDVLIPAGDALTVLTHHGSTAAALGIHAATAAVVAVTAGLLLTERHGESARPTRPTRPSRASRPARQTRRTA
ncbi:DUF4267 domain-containing protein [Kitasatospora sp. NPDC056446]|uniref:DUF4267 domain-containing protein n=1 Tax=Kitasatospora sp. NPDC056446 TaxID=3345819 RepID=UPI00368A8DDD